MGRFFGSRRCLFQSVSGLFLNGSLLTKSLTVYTPSFSLNSGANTLNSKPSGSFTNYSLSGVISGAGDLIISGNITLSSASTYTGATTIALGTVSLSGSGAIASSSSVTVNGSLNIGAVTTSSSVVTLAGYGNIILGSKMLIVTNGSTTHSGAISGTGAMIVSGGTQTFTGAFSYTGNTTVSGGATFAYNFTTSYPSWVSPTVSINGASTFSINGAGPFMGNTNFVFDATGGGTANFAGNTINGNGTSGSGMTFTTNGGSSNTFSGFVNLFNNTSVVNFSIAAGTGGSPGLVVNAYLNNGAATMNKTGAGTLRFSNATTSFPGGTININAGQVQLISSASLGGTGSATTVAATAGIGTLTTTAGALGSLTFSALSSFLQVTALSTINASKLTCTTLTASSGFTVNIGGAMNAGTYPILVSTSGTPTPTLGTNTTGRTVTFAWVANTLNMILV